MPGTVITISFVIILPLSISGSGTTSHTSTEGITQSGPTVGTYHFSIELISHLWAKLAIIRLLFNNFSLKSIWPPQVTLVAGQTVTIGQTLCLQNIKIYKDDWENTEPSKSKSDARSSMVDPGQTDWCFQVIPPLNFITSPLPLA